MASSSAGAAKGGASKDANALANALYDKCISDYSPDHLFYQQDLQKLDVVASHDLALLMQCAQILVDRNLFRMLHGRDDRLAWKVIEQSDAEK